jgi:hypothetical protein
MSFTSEKNFSQTKFDGGCRDAFQFIKFFYSMLEREGISSIVNLTLSPNIKAPDDIMMIRKTHKQILESAKVQFDHDTLVNKAAILSWHTTVNQIRGDQALTIQEAHDAVLALGQCPTPLIWIQPNTQYTPHVSAQYESYKKELHRQDDTASKALSLLKELCTPRLNDFCSAGVYDLENRRPREKLLHMWEWIKGLRVSDPSVINEVQDDIKNLPPISSFSQAVANIASINNLQRELMLMRQPYSDENLILLHANKLDGSDMFKQLRKQFLHSDHSRRLSTAPDMTRPLTTSGGGHRPTFTWEDYCVADAMLLGRGLLVGEAVGVACWNVAVRNMLCDAFGMT